MLSRIFQCSVSSFTTHSRLTASDFHLLLHTGGVVPDCTSALSSVLVCVVQQTVVLDWELRRRLTDPLHIHESVNISVDELPLKPPESSALFVPLEPSVTSLVESERSFRWLSLVELDRSSGPSWSWRPAAPWSPDTGAPQSSGFSSVLRPLRMMFLSVSACDAARSCSALALRETPWAACGTCDGNVLASFRGTNITMVQVLNVLHALLSARLSTSVFCFFPSAVSYALSNQPQGRSFTRCGSALLPAVGPLCLFFVVTVNHPSRRCSLWTAVIASPLLRAATVHHVLRHVLTVHCNAWFRQGLALSWRTVRPSTCWPTCFPPHTAPLRAARGPLVVTPASTTLLSLRALRVGSLIPELGCSVLCIHVAILLWSVIVLCVFLLRPPGLDPAEAKSRRDCSCALAFSLRCGRRWAWLRASWSDILSVSGGALCSWWSFLRSFQCLCKPHQARPHGPLTTSHRETPSWGLGVVVRLRPSYSLRAALVQSHSQVHLPSILWTRVIYSDCSALPHTAQIPAETVVAWFTRLRQKSSTDMIHQYWIREISTCLITNWPHPGPSASFSAQSPWCFGTSRWFGHCVNDVLDVPAHYLLDGSLLDPVSFLWSSASLLRSKACVWPLTKLSSATCWPGLWSNTSPLRRTPSNQPCSACSSLRSKSHRTLPACNLQCRSPSCSRRRGSAFLPRDSSTSNAVWSIPGFRLPCGCPWQWQWEELPPAVNMTSVMSTCNAPVVMFLLKSLSRTHWHDRHEYNVAID